MEEQIVKDLIERGWHISFAESCTGGLAAAALVSVPDASKVLDVSFITYANEAKLKYLGVKQESIADFGVVSEQVAQEMAEGVAKAAGCEVGVGITGVAGPSGGTEQNPVGMVCFGFYLNGNCYTDTCQFGDIGRNEVRQSSVEYVYRRLGELFAKGRADVGNLVDKL